MDAKDERADLLDRLLTLVYLIEQTEDPDKVAEYVDQFYKLKAEILALGSAKK